jgi:hypothetical protein
MFNLILFLREQVWIECSLKIRFKKLDIVIVIFTRKHKLKGSALYFCSPHLGSLFHKSRKCLDYQKQLT